MDIIFTWELKKKLNTFSKLVDSLEDGNEVVINWYGKDSFKKLLKDNGNDVQWANEWARDGLKCDILHLNYLLQQIANETKDNELVQRRLKAVGYTPEE